MHKMGAATSHPSMRHRQYARDSLSHDCSASEGSDEDESAPVPRANVPVEGLEAFMGIHFGAEENVIAALARRSDSISMYLMHHGFLRLPVEGKEQLKALTELYNTNPLFIDVYADALFQSGSSLRLRYSTSLNFKPGYTTEYIYLVIAYNLPAISTTMERYGHHLYGIAEITNLQGVQNLIKGVMQRGGNAVMAIRAAITECAPDLLRGYPTLSRSDFVNRNTLISKADAFASPTDQASALEYRHCTFSYFLGIQGRKFVLDKPAIRAPVAPRAKAPEPIAPSPSPLLSSIPPPVVKLKRSAFAVYSNRKYDNSAPNTPVKAPPLPEWEPEPKHSECLGKMYLSESKWDPEPKHSELPNTPVTPQAEPPKPPVPPQDELPKLQSSLLRPYEVPAALDVSILAIPSVKPAQEDDPLTCPICMDSRRDQVLACGHFLCEDCSAVKVCPFCRVPVERRTKVFWS